MRKYFLRKKEGKNILDRFLKNLGIEYSNLFKANPKIEAIEIQANKRIILIDDFPCIIEINDRLYPSLIFNEALNRLPKITVDMGAIPHVCNGADIMAPGIKKVEGSFEQKSIVVIVDEKYSKPIAIGEANIPSRLLIEVKHGKVIKNIHYVGDKFWKVLKELKKV